MHSFDQSRKALPREPLHVLPQLVPNRAIGPPRAVIPSPSRSRSYSEPPGCVECRDSDFAARHFAAAAADVQFATGPVLTLWLFLKPRCVSCGWELLPVERRCSAVPFSRCVASIMPRLCSLATGQPRRRSSASSWRTLSSACWRNRRSASARCRSDSRLGM